MRRNDKIMPALKPKIRINRAIYKWIESLDLTYSVRNLRRDLANGFVVAEILSRYMPEKQLELKGNYTIDNMMGQTINQKIDLYTYYNGTSLKQKEDNWQRIAKILNNQQQTFKLLKTDYDPIIHLAPNAAFEFLKRLYSHIRMKEIPELEGEEQEDDLPFYTKPTASTLAKDRELTRIIDNDEKRLKTHNTINIHRIKRKYEIKNSNIMEYVERKRQEQIAQMLEEKRKALDEKKKRTMKIADKQDMIQNIELESYNSSAGKKTQDRTKQVHETLGVIEYLQEIIESAKDQQFYNEIVEALKEIDDVEINKDSRESVMSELIINCNFVPARIFDAFLMLVKENTHEIIDKIKDSFIDFQKFFELFSIPLRFLSYKSTSFALLADLLKEIGQELIALEEQNDRSMYNAQVMFESLVLEDFAQILVEFSNKQNMLTQVMLAYTSSFPQSKRRILIKLQEYLLHHRNTFIAILAYTVSTELQFDEVLYEMMKQNAETAIMLPSPYTRTFGLKILNEISNVNFYPVLSLIEKFDKLINDDWWEVKAQILIICTNLLLYLSEEENQQGEQQQDQIKESNDTKLEETQQEEEGEGQQSQQVEEEVTQQGNQENVAEEQKEGGQLSEQKSQGEDLKPEDVRDQYQQILLELILSFFNVHENKNILKIGLIYLAPALVPFPQICERYYQVLLQITEEIRNSVLYVDQEGVEEGLAFFGSCNFQYKLFGAPLYWNAVGIAESLNAYVKENEMDSFEKEHVDILRACLVKELQVEDKERWLDIYDHLKEYIFLSLCDKRLCELASEILKKLFFYEAIQDDILNKSKKIFLNALRLLYKADSEYECRQNLLNFFEDLYPEDKKFRNYFYSIIKEFSEMHLKMFLESNLVDFMNTISRKRREELFPQLGGYF